MWERARERGRCHFSLIETATNWLPRQETLNRSPAVYPHAWLNELDTLEVGCIFIVTDTRQMGRNLSSLSEMALVRFFCFTGLVTSTFILGDFLWCPKQIYLNNLKRKFWILLSALCQDVSCDGWGWQPVRFSFSAATAFHAKWTVARGN